MKALFLGTPVVAVPFLRELAKSNEVVGVVSQPDKPAGRGLTIEPTPVKKAALELGLKVFQPNKPSEIAGELKALNADVAVVVAYGRILKPDVLSVTKHGFLNVHFSLLPLYRGAAPVQWSLVRGETETGVTLFWLDEGMDTGPILLQKKTKIGPEENAQELLGRLGALGTEALREGLEQVAQGKVTRTPQAGAPSLAPLIKTEDARIDLNRPAREIHNLVRGFRMWPKAYLLQKSGKRIIALKTALSDENPPQNNAPGRIIRIDKSGGILVECSRSCIWFLEVQSEGKKPTPAAEFVNGLRLGLGDLLPL
jgi:methionyl-tRNA formyltransferase